MNSVSPPIARAMRVEPQLAGQEERQDDGGHEEDRDQRHAADDLDVAGAQHADDGQVAAPPERQQHAERERQHDADDGEQRTSAAARPTAWSLTDGSGVPAKPVQQDEGAAGSETSHAAVSARRGTSAAQRSREGDPARSGRVDDEGRHGHDARGG